MRILAVVQGLWGQRFVDNIRSRGPHEWTIETYRPPARLPIILDDPEEFLPPTMPQVDLVLAFTESSSSAQLIPAIAKRSGARAVLCPIDNSAWMRTGLKNQLQRELEQMGVESAFPKTFCTLTEEAVGYRRAAQPYTSQLISEFARYFGRPKLNMTVNPETGIIERIEVVRGSPCGATHYMAARLEGTPAEDALPGAGLLSHQYPCLAAMDREMIDDRLEDTLMHLSGLLVNEEVEEKLRPYKKQPQYITPSQREETPGGGST
ncbi:MAG: hypothetical protein HW388_134 [Dehalococcoidia bacterium]|nr:hypothetical protein [Dehalococcoidia bacterium]